MNGAIVASETGATLHTKALKWLLKNCMMGRFLKLANNNFFTAEKEGNGIRRERELTPRNLCSSSSLRLPSLKGIISYRSEKGT